MATRPPLSSFVGKPPLSVFQRAPTQTRPPLSSFVGTTPTPPKPQSMFGKVAGAVGNAVGNFGLGLAKGVAKGAMDTGQSIASGVSAAIGPAKFLQPYKNKLAAITKNPQVSPLTGNVENALQPKGQAQQAGSQVGFPAEKIGEFFVPGGVEKKAFETGAAHLDELPKVIGMIDKLGNPTAAGKALANTLKVALRGGITAGSTGLVTDVQGGSPSDVKSNATLGGIFGAGGQALESFGKGLGVALQKSGFKLSPLQESKVAQKAQSAAQFMTDNKVLGSDETKYNKLNALNSSLEETLQNSLPKDLKIAKDGIVKSINSTVESLKQSDPAIYKAARTDANEAIGLLNGKEKDITVKQALDSKRSYGKAAFKQTKFAVRDPRVVSEGSYAVEQAFQKALHDTLDAAKSTIKIPKELQNYFGGKTEVALQDFNKVYSDAINAKNLTNLARFKNDTGLIGRMFGLWAGEAVGQVVAPGLPGKIIGGATGEILSNRVPSLVRNAGERALSTSPGTAAGAAKSLFGIQKQPNQ